MNLKKHKKEVEKLKIMEEKKLIKKVSKILTEKYKYNYPNLELGYMKALILATQEALNMRKVSRSVWMVQNKDSLIVHGMFSTKVGANNYINGSEGYDIKELRVI